MRAIFLATATAVAVVLAGCGGDVPRGRIHGTVTFQGKPITGATVIFLAKDNKTHPVKLKPDGSYEVAGVALGAVKVSLQQDLPDVASKAQTALPTSEAKGVTDDKAGRRAPPAPETRGKSAGPALTARYADADKSGLGFELKDADQEWSVDLK